MKNIIAGFVNNVRRTAAKNVLLARNEVLEMYSHYPTVKVGGGV